MSFSRSDFLKHYGSLLLLLAGLVLGSLVGIFFGGSIGFLKPVGDVFINLLFTVVVPLVFFAIASALANIGSDGQFGKLVLIMFLVFIGTEFIAASVTLVTAMLFPLQLKMDAAAVFTENSDKISVGDQITHLLTAGDFFELLSRKNMLALIIFATLTGFATLKAGEKGRPFREFLNSGNEVLKNVLLVIMKMGPVGLGAYFAVQTATIGPALFGTYAKAMALFHGVSIFYYIVFFSLYAFVAGGISSVRRYWKNNVYPSATAVGTCSSIASIPVNLQAATAMGIPAEVSSLVIPIGAPLHKDGSAISSITKIVVVFAMLHKPLEGFGPLALALGISVIVSMVEGGIPNGGYVGELLIISAYGLPREVIPAVMILGTLVDPIATLLNVTGDTVAAMLITRFWRGRHSGAGSEKEISSARPGYARS